MTDLEIMKKRWKENILFDISIYDSENDIIKKTLSDIEKDAFLFSEGVREGVVFEDILWDKSADITQAYSRVYKMALGYCTCGTVAYKNKELEEKILFALEWLHENRYGEREMRQEGWRDIRDFNWWDWNIGAPKFLIDTLMIMSDEVEAAVAQRYLKLFDMLVPVPRDYGANKLDFAKLIIGSALLRNDAEKISNVFEKIKDMFDYCDGEDVWMQHKQPGNNGQGFYSDGSYIFHTKHPMNGTYGLEFYITAIALYSLTKGTVFEFSEDIKQKLKQWYKVSFMNLVHYGTMSRMVMGREPEYVESRAIAIIKVGIDVLRLFGDDEEIRAFISENVGYIGFENLSCPLRNIMFLKEILQKTDGAVKDFSKVYYFSDKVVHKRDGYTFAISMSSSRIYNYECINNQNMNGWYISDGMTCLYNENNRYSEGYWKNVNPYYLPGTTVDSQVRQEVSIRQSNEYLSGEDFVGGATYDNMYSVVAMNLESYHSEGKFSENDLFPNARKEYGSAPPKHNCSLKAKKAWFLFDDELVCMGCDITASDDSAVRTVILNGNHNIISGDGYFIADEFGTVILDDTDYQIKDFGEYKAVTIEHGINPDKKVYVYTIYPNQYTHIEKNTEILSNTDIVQAVRHKKLGLCGYVFREAYDFDGIKVSDSVILIISDKQISACDPTHKNRKISVFYNGKEYVFDFSKTYGKTITIKV